VPEYTPPIVRRNTSKGHHYVDAKGVRVPGVTTIVKNGVPKGDALVGWAAKSTAQYAVDHAATLAEMGPAARYEKLLKARYEDRDTAANRGTAVHRLGEALLRGESPMVPAELVGHVESYAKFLDEFQFEAVHVEFGCISYRFGRSGTADVCGWLTHPDMGRILGLLDVKTSRSGIFGEVALQLAGYLFADYWHIDGVETEPLAVDGCFALHVRADGYSLHPLEVTEEEHRMLWHAQCLGTWAKDSRDLVGEPIIPPVTSRFRLQRLDEQGGAL
jgi:hypothetical protein